MQGAGQGLRPHCRVPWLLLAPPGLSRVHLGAWRAVISQDISKKEKCFLSSLVLFFFILPKQLFGQVTIWEWWGR